MNGEVSVERKFSPSQPGYGSEGCRQSMGTTTNNGARRFSATELGRTVGMPYSFDTMRYLKDVMRRREDIHTMRVMPKTHLLAQLVLLEQSGREMLIHQERFCRQQIAHKRDDERSKREEQRLQQKNRDRLEEMKRKQVEELAALKEGVTSFQRQIDAEVKEKLRIVCMLQPRMNVAAAVLAEVKNEASPFLLLPELMEEEKRVAKALKADSRYSKSSADSGAVPHWMRTCVAGSFNVAAILQDAPYRATVDDAVKVTNAFLRKVVVVRDVNDRSVVGWVHVRAGSDPATLATELVRLPAPEELPDQGNIGVVWPKEDFLELSRRAKANNNVETQQLLQSVLGISSASLHCVGLTTHEFSKKEVDTIGSLASV
ncbi:hypothetical protein C3747_6g402 [Trypanosoma cruzi]|uniref:Uncharacterized protein n=2 Tax=Trypanosoma cruzi TaxID=5693 RepID=Q4D0N8_TRYCC|nr:hypothetical protein, conserved [Trypanosoma cruzi]EAN86093.1 hypothetical protein, conserved [Trypanosoma cruzi]PWV20561.1 hypothetical protein C3747_6g402 [Trypanosoma cruzi]|eukprot:XP_807944.1 hypothetical protein [Trypanosoma cruzi strain CL Brener]